MSTATDTIATRAENLRKVYGKEGHEVVALHDLTWSFAANSFHAIMGPSGSGKSTLMHCLAGLDRPTSGKVWIGDDELGQMKDSGLTRLRRTAVGFVFQSFNLVPTLSAEENIRLPMAIAGRPVDQEWFNQVIAAVGLKDRLRHRPTELSGGQQQRVACARALLSRPTVVFADEPTGNLDSSSAAEVMTFLRDSQREFEQTIIMVTHDATAASYADRVLFLADGRIVTELMEPTRRTILEQVVALDPRHIDAEAN